MAGFAGKVKVHGNQPSSGAASSVSRQNTTAERRARSASCQVAIGESGTRPISP